LKKTKWNKNSLEEMRTRTLELLGSNDAKEPNTLTNPTLTEMKNSNWIAQKPRMKTAYSARSGHSKAYGSNGQPTYEFMSTASCAFIGVAYALERDINQSEPVNHFSTLQYRCNQNNNNTAVLAFRRR
jgi:hypothetical protein